MATTFEKIWETDNPPSEKWPLYTRGNVGEVFPEVVLPFTWDLIGGAAERGWRQAFEKMGLVADGDFPPDEDMVILSVFGGYCYINASYVRILGVRAPGGDVATIDSLFFGGSDAPDYEQRDGDKNLGATLRLGKTLLRLLSTQELPAMEQDKTKVERFVGRHPGDNATNEELMAYCRSFEPFFEHLFSRHIDNTFSNALVSGALADLVVKAGKPDLLVSILGGIGDIESAAPSAAMWDLSRLDPDTEAHRRGFEQFLADFGTRGPNEWDIGSDPRAELNFVDRFQFDKAYAATKLFSQARERSKTTVIKAIHPVRRARATMHERAAAAAGPGAGIGVDERWKSCLLNVEEFVRYLDAPVSFGDLIAERAELHGRLSNLDSTVHRRWHRPVDRQLGGARVHRRPAFIG